jgi:hypothetical protein
MSDQILDDFEKQAAFCRETGSELTGRVLDALRVVMDHDSRTGSRILDWPGNPMEDALMLRITGGLNGLVRSGRDAELSALYRTGQGDWEAVIARVLREHDDWLYPWLDGPPQTNEVGRSGILYPGLMEIARRYGPDIELIELGASGGLNLNMDRFAYDLGGAKAGDPDATVRLWPEWTGPDPAIAPVNIVARRGVDLNPIDLTDDKAAERMLAYIWPDQTERLQRAEAAIAMLRAHTPVVDTGDAVGWLIERLAEPQAAGVTRVVYHSSFMPYLKPEARAAIKTAMFAAAKGATETRPLAWLMKEPTEVVVHDKLLLRSWPGDGGGGGRLEILAECHPHGKWIKWADGNG